MPRPRLAVNEGLPLRWCMRRGQYYYQVPRGHEPFWDFKKLFRLGRTYEEAMRRFSATGKRPSYDTREALLSVDTIVHAAAIAPVRREGVYFLLYGSVVVYVGKSNNVHSRVLQHVSDCRILFDRWHFVPASGPRQDRLEKRYIAKFAPTHNIQCVNL